MNETSDLLERVGDRFAFPADAFDRLERRRDIKRRNRRVAAGVAGIAIFAALVFGIARATLSDSPTPANRPTPSPSPSIEPRASVIEGNEVVVSGPSNSIEAVDRTTGNHRTLVTCDDPCIFFSEAAVSADRRWLAYSFETCLGALPCEPEAGLWALNALGDRTQLVQTCEPGHCYPLLWAWSPTEDVLAVAGPTNPPSGPRSIYLIDPATGRRTEVADSAPGQEETLTWSPDGSRLAYDGDGSVHIVDVNGGSPIVLPDAWKPSWSPDGTRLSIVNVPDVYVVNADGTGLHLAAAGGEATWSPDGTRLATIVEQGDAGGGFHEGIWVVRADGSGATNILPGGCCHGGIVKRSLRWSPDGTRVAFQDGSERWRVVDADGSGSLGFIDAIEVAAWPSR